VRRLLAFARRQQLEPASIDVGSLEDAMNDLLAHTLGGLVELDWQIADDVWCVFADRPQLELALMNLIINARDAMPDGGSIQISAENRTIEEDEGMDLSGGSYVVLSVTDQGCGILPKDLDKVMEPFFTTKEVGKGTGLGLSMVYGFAKQSNGGFQLHSEVGRGTRAEIWLPRAARPAELRTAASAENPLPKPQRALAVLLIDDHNEVRAATAAMLEELGHKVVQHASGAEAVEALSERGFQCDLLITDFAMPSMSGGELVRQARELRPGMPTLIVTGYAEGDGVGAGKSETGVLFKPFTLDALSSAVNRAVTRGKAPGIRKAAAVA
jgi:CheY-like chemotaxis protein